MCDIETLRRILKTSQRVAMVGLSANWYRPSNFAAKYLIDHGYTLIPVNPNYEEALGQKCYPSLLEIPEPVDVVDIFQRPDKVPPLVEQAIEIGAKVVWMQLGVVHPEAAERARQAGIGSGHGPLYEDRVWPPVRGPEFYRRKHEDHILRATHVGPVLISGDNHG